MANNPQIIKVGSGVYVFTVPNPMNYYGDLRVPWSVCLGDAKVFPGDTDNSFFILTLSPCELSETVVRRALQYIWDRLIEHGVVSGSMPEPIEGNPFDMLPK